MTRLRWLLVSLALFLASCSLTSVQPDITERPNLPLLEKGQARLRSVRVSHVTYQVSLSLPAENVPFEGTARIHFNLNDNRQPLTLDFVDGEVLSLRLNGKQIAPDYNGNFIILPATALRMGRQSVEVVYRHAYVRDGQGLHWFRDPEDGEAYIYTQFEPWAFNKVFPGFDQPDIKATYRLDVEAPSHWQVISAERENRIEDVGNNRRRWYFPDTQAFSTYLLSVHAGPYNLWEEKDPFRIPLRLFARKSYAQYVDVHDWFRVTRQGFDYFEVYFGYPYPFSKYDQLLVPEFNFGAMENVGAVTFAERLQPRREKNDADRKRMAVVVLHELAHHWFGNLVTMRWWDDLWLNESFAELMGSMATARATVYSSAMMDFSTSSKTWAYEEDQWNTTHPIVQDIKTTEMVLASLDGITYAKGASSLIQLQHLLGADVFQQGLVNYFSRYAWQNTSLHDFMDTLAQAAGRDLSRWTRQWLMSEGVNALKIHYDCEDGKIHSFNLQQQAANVSGILREHSLDILMMNEQGARTLINTNIHQTDNPVADAIGKPCPAFILPNVSDHTFARILLDTKSLDYVQHNLGKFQNPVERGMIWRSLWESVRSAQFSPQSYLDLGLRYLAHEQDVTLLRSQSYNLSDAYAYLELHDQLHPDRKPLAPERTRQLEAMAYERYVATSGALKEVWAEIWMQYMQTERHLELLKQELVQNNLSLDQRWIAVGALIREKDPDGQKWLDHFKALDKSANAQINEWTALAQEGTLQAKQPWIAAARDPAADYSYTQLRAVLNRIYPRGQLALQHSIRADIVERIPDLVSTLQPQSLALYVSRLVPRMCSLQSSQELLRLAHLPNMPEQAMRSLKQQSQDEEMCVGVLQALVRESFDK